EGESRRRGIASLAEETTAQQREKIQTGDPGGEISGGDVFTRINHLGGQPTDREEDDFPRPQGLRLEKAGPCGPEEAEDKGGPETENEDARMLQGRVERPPAGVVQRPERQPEDRRGDPQREKEAEGLRGPQRGIARFGQVARG